MIRAKLQFLIWMLIFSGCTKTVPKATSNQSVNFTSSFIVEQSNTIVVGEGTGQFFSFQVSCEIYAIDFEVKLSGDTTWISAKRNAESSSDFECSDNLATLIFSGSVFNDLNGASELLVRQVFPFGYSNETSITIVKTESNPVIDLDVPPYLNTDFSKSLEVSGECSLDNTVIVAYAVPAADYGTESTNDELDSIATAVSEFNCESSIANGSIDFSGQSLGLYKIIIKYKNLTPDQSSPDVNDMEYIVAPVNGLAWATPGGSFTVVEGADFVNALTSVLVQASHPDPSAIIEYAVDSTTCSANWNSTISVNDSGTLSGSPSGYAPGSITAVEETCNIVITSSSRSEVQSTTVSLSVENNYCSSGTLDTTCSYGSNVTLHDGLILYGDGSIQVDSGITVSIAPTQSVSIDLGGMIEINGSFNVNVTSLLADGLSIPASGQINLDTLGYQGQDNAAGLGPGAGNAVAGDGAGHAGLGGGANCRFSDKVGGAIDGTIADANTYGSSGFAAGVGDFGGHGGGLFIATLNSLSLEGSISSNGGAATLGGGGSGGSIKITTGSFTGSGSISVTGGDASLTAGYGYGGGSGGYINISSETSNYSGSIDISGGWGSVETGLTTNGVNGSYGVAKFQIQDICDSGDYSSSCTVSSTKILTQSTVALNDLILTSSANIKNPMNEDIITINSSGNVEFQSGSLVESSLDLNATGTVLVTGTINASGKGALGGGGCETGKGPATGGGTYGDGSSGGGAHFVDGGESETLGEKGIAYGVIGTPTFGAGGAGGSNKDYSYTARGGSGGGQVLITSSSTITVNGSIFSNGEDAFNKTGAAFTEFGAGGGAGGYVQLDSSELFGTGSISVNGGAAGQQSGIGAGAGFDGGGGGSYGHIEVIGSNSFTGSTSLNMGTNGY